MSSFIEYFMTWTAHWNDIQLMLFTIAALSTPNFQEVYYSRAGCYGS